MLLKKFILVIFIAFFSANLFAQKDSTNIVFKTIKKKRKKTQGIYNPLAPSKAAFYSAIFPGMGQIYNKKYWKAPIVWGALAIPIYYYQVNNSEFKRFRSAYTLRKNGLIDEFTVNGVELVSLESLENAQEQLKSNRDLSLLSFIIVYILQIVEASVNAHLLQFNTDDNLSFKPIVIPDPILIDPPTVGLRIKYTF